VGVQRPVESVFMVDAKRFSLPLTRMVHENLSIIMCYAYSQQPLTELVKRKFAGSWKYLNKALFEISEERVNKACLELALFLRMVDDEEGLSTHFANLNKVPNCGTLIMKDGSRKLLPFREVANKVIHSSRLEWKFSKNDDPVLICHTGDKEKWLRAEVDVVALAAVCGTLMS
jgi:hypothetical protein